MKKLLACLFILLLLANFANAQMAHTRRNAFGISFIKNDFTTPQQIRSASLATVLRNKSQATIGEMNSGVSLSYVRGILPHVDLSAALDFSSVNLPLPEKKFTEKHLLVEATATHVFKLLHEGYRANPYALVGVGGSLYKNIWGAILPVGAGIKVKIKDETQVFLQGQYRIPITPEANNYHFQLSLGITGWFGKK